MAQTLKFGNGTWATKKGSTLAYNDQNNRYKPLPFTTTRASGATRVNKQGLIEVVEGDRPRIDYTDSADGALLLENSSTNLITYSEDTSNWSTQSSSVLTTSNQAISPDGTLNADKLIPATGSVTSNGGRYVSFSSTAGTDYSVSVFVKQAEYRYVTFSYGSTAAYGFHFDLQDGVIIQELGNAQYTTISKEVESFSNGWYRLKISLTDALSVGTRFISVRPANEEPTAINNNYATTGDGTSGIYVWGLQIEQGSYATSYIPTQGSTVTRVADTASGAGNSEVFNDSEGVLMAEISSQNDSSTKLISLASTSGSENTVWIGYANGVYSVIRSNGATAVETNIVPTQSNELTKCAILYSNSNVKFYINGFNLFEDTNISMPIGLDQLRFSRKGGSLPFYGNTKQLQYYNTALTDSELEILTSWTSFTDLANGQQYSIK